jgi:hypothetical protein
MRLQRRPPPPPQRGRDAWRRQSALSRPRRHRRGLSTAWGGAGRQTRAGLPARLQQLQGRPASSGLQRQRSGQRGCCHQPPQQRQPRHHLAAAPPRPPTRSRSLRRARRAFEPWPGSRAQRESHCVRPCARWEAVQGYRGQPSTGRACATQQLAAHRAQSPPQQPTGHDSGQQPFLRPPERRTKPHPHPPHQNRSPASPPLVVWASGQPSPWGSGGSRGWEQAAAAPHPPPPPPPHHRPRPRRPLSRPGHCLRPQHTQP